jgi:NAD(P)-dependent dehydrogenase (short-subunit alcohol dehydrogenase family)
MGVLDEMVAIVTGGGQGVGRGVALALAAEGARVAVAGRTLDKCEAVAKEVAERGGVATAIRCDVSNRAEVDACVAATLAAWGRIDVLVNSAQSKKYGSVKRMTEDDVDEQWQSGPMGTLRFMQACLPHLIETKGSVVNLGSGSGLEAQAGMAAYAMVKESIRTLSRVAAVEWGRHGVRVNVICPLSDSPGLDEWRNEMPGAFESQVINRVPLGRVGDPEHDIGRAVVYLAGPDGRYVTGTTLMVDGGYTYLR